MYFYTDSTTNISQYCLCNIKYYHKLKNKKAIMIDPSVYELKKSNEYSRISELHNIAKSNSEYISIDYPCDMNPIYTDEFIAKTNQNNARYAEQSKYITTIQYKFQDFESFRLNFKRNLPFMKGKIVGIGNLCRIMYPNQFTDLVFDYLLQYQQFRYHFYGLSLRLIKRYLPLFEQNKIEFSIDSTKWTRACTNELKKQYGLNCSKKTRDIFFLAYIHELKKIFNNVVF